MYKKLRLSLLIVWIMFCIPVAKADVQDVSFRFCEDTGNKTFMAWKKTIFVTPGKETEICINFTTTSNTPRKVVYGFTKWVLSAGMQVCDSDKWPNNEFSKYFTTSGEREFIITNNQPQTIREKIMLPIGMSGVQYGCLAYSLGVLEGTGLWWMFNLVVNKVFPISLFVGSSADINNNLILLKNSGGSYTTNTLVKANIDNANNLKLSFLVKNNGNIGQQIQITGKVNNVLWFEKDFSIQVNNLAPGAQQEVVADVGLVPSYKWFFGINFNVYHEPKFEFDISTLGETIKKWATIVGSAQIYIFSWITLAIIIVILAIIIKLFWPRKKIIVRA